MSASSAAARSAAAQRRFDVRLEDRGQGWDGQHRVRDQLQLRALDAAVVQLGQGARVRDGGGDAEALVSRAQALHVLGGAERGDDVRRAHAGADVAVAALPVHLPEAGLDRQRAQQCAVRLAEPRLRAVLHERQAALGEVDALIEDLGPLGAVAEATLPLPGAEEPGERGEFGGEVVREFSRHEGSRRGPRAGRAWSALALEQPADDDGRHRGHAEAGQHDEGQEEDLERKKGIHARHPTEWGAQVRPGSPP